MAFRLLSRLPRGSLPFCRYKSTSTVVQAVEGIRQLAQPVAFVSVKGWEPEGVASWQKFANLFAKRGYSSLLIEIDPPSSPSSTSEALLASLESELVSVLSAPDASPFPPLLISSSLSTLLAETYVSSHPLSGLLLHSPVSPLTAHKLFPKVFQTPLKEFTYEPTFPIAVMEQDEKAFEKEGGRLLDEFGPDKTGEVKALAGGKDAEGFKAVMWWMDATGL